MPETRFDDVRAANEAYAAAFALAGLEPTAARGLAVVTCMDSRIEPLAALGLGPGDAKILRNAGARVTRDVLRTLVLAVALLGVDRILVMPHTRCRMAGQDETEVHDEIERRTGLDTRSLEFSTVMDQEAHPADRPPADPLLAVDPGRCRGRRHDLRRRHGSPRPPPGPRLTGAGR